MIEELKTKYPELFSEGEMEPINLFGIECDEGWVDIIRNTCSHLYSGYKQAKNSYEYWRKQAAEPSDKYKPEEIEEHLDKHLARLSLAESNIPKIEQIKEKFGALRIYTSTYNDYARGVLDMAESMSENICEVCGNKGMLYPFSWMKTLCTDHAEARYGEKAKKYQEEQKNK
jgi:hypothetical protein